MDQTYSTAAWFCYMTTAMLLQGDHAMQHVMAYTQWLVEYCLHSTLNCCIHGYRTGHGC